MPYYPPSGGGGSSTSAGLAGTGGYFIVGSAQPLLPGSRILTAGSSINVRTDATSIYIDATTGGGASSTPFPCAPGFIPLDGMKYISANSGNVGSGDINLYTVPVGKHAFWAYSQYYNTRASGNITATPKVLVGGTSRIIDTTSSASPGGAQIVSPRYVGEAGESFILNVDNTGGNIYLSIVEFNTGGSFRSPKVYNFSSGYNLVYTVNPGSSAIVLNINYDFESTFNGAKYYNGTSATRVVRWVQAKSGQAISSNFFVTQTSEVTTLSLQNSIFRTTLSGGDTIHIASDTNSVGQFAWIPCVMEF